MAVSLDPVALDKASSDLCQKAERFKDTQIGDHIKSGYKATSDLWRDSTHASVWETALEHGEKIGLGTREYDLVSCK